MQKPKTKQKNFYKLWRDEQRMREYLDGQCRRLKKQRRALIISLAIVSGIACAVIMICI